MKRSWSRVLCVGASFALLLTTVSCGDDGESTPTTPASTNTQSISATTDSDAAPSELSGDWRTEVAGDSVTLTIGQNSYRIQRGSDTGSGRIAFKGAEISFLRSDLCEGEGTYSWTVEGSQLRLTAVSPDPCPRREVLDGVVYTRR